MTSTAVNPAILRVVGDVGRPERGYDALSDTRHIPGTDGLLAGLANLWGRIRHGHAHPEWQARLRTKARRLTTQPVRYHEFKRLELHDLVWKETLRYYPVAPSIPRQALRDVTLGGHHIPAGTVVGVVLGAALRDPSCWTEPDRFDPERFGAERGSLSGNVKLSVEAVGR